MLPYPSMAKDHIPTNHKTFHFLCYLLFFLCFLSSISFIYYSHCSSPCSPQTTITSPPYNHSSTINLLSFPSSWNLLSFSSNPPPKHLKIALFVKRWPRQNLAGGLERHALTLHLFLARRGHDVHVFTTNSSFPYYSNAALTFHPIPPSPGGYLNQALAWKEFQIQNYSHPFDVVHTESVGLFHGRARNLTRLAVSWHGIAYETLHSDIVQDLLREPKEPRQSGFANKLGKVVEEVKFFRNYAHHVATSDHVGDVLKRVYMIPEERVHIIVNGVDEEIYRPNKRSSTGSFRRKFGVPESAQLVIGMAGRLVRDKGHPLMFECLKRAFMEDLRFKTSVFVLVAGDGPWASRYRDLGPNLILLGPLDQTQLSEFYNSLDIFLNPTLRAQGLDHTFIEAMLSGVAVMGTRFASITGSIIVSSEVGYTFQPTVESLKESIFKAFSDGRAVLRKKGESARNRALRLFTAKKMGAAYERLFLCISDNVYCNFPLPADREK